VESRSLATNREHRTRNKKSFDSDPRYARSAVGGKTGQLK
jgi:hypothetical protein